MNYGCLEKEEDEPVQLSRGGNKADVLLIVASTNDTMMIIDVAYTHRAFSLHRSVFARVQK